jgi:hypothetical protein
MGYNGQRGPNVSEFIANLNTIPAAQEVGSEGLENFNYEADLAIFTNTEFLDFDIDQNADYQPTDFDFNAPPGVDQESIEFLPGKFRSIIFLRFIATILFPSQCLRSCIFHNISYLY